MSPIKHIQYKYMKRKKYIQELKEYHYINQYKYDYYPMIDEDFEYDYFGNKYIYYNIVN